MKKIIFATLLALSFSAHAEKWLEMPNRAGGKIILLSNKCDSKSEGKSVIATMPAGTNTNGCWYYFADMVHVVWSDGTTSSFEIDNFKVKGKE